MKESRNKGSERRKIIARTRNQHMRSVHSPFSFTSFPSQFTSLQSFSALNNRARHLLKVPGPIPFFDITKHYRANRAKGWDEGMAAWQSLILCKPLLETQGFLRGMAWWVQHILSWNCTKIILRRRFLYLELRKIYIWFFLRENKAWSVLGHFSTTHE